MHLVGITSSSDDSVKLYSGGFDWFYAYIVVCINCKRD